MDKKTRLKYLRNLVEAKACLVENQDTQKQVLALFDNYTAMMPDGKMKDALEKMKRRRDKKDYCKLIGDYVEDLFDTKWNIINDTLLSLMINSLFDVTDTATKNAVNDFCGAFNNVAGNK